MINNSLLHSKSKISEGNFFLEHEVKNSDNHLRKLNT